MGKIKGFCFPFSFSSRIFIFTGGIFTFLISQESPISLAGFSFSHFPISHFMHFPSGPWADPGYPCQGESATHIDAHFTERVEASIYIAYLRTRNPISPPSACYVDCVTSHGPYFDVSLFGAHTWPFPTPFTVARRKDAKFPHTSQIQASP